jgi:hypothetical protein
MNETTDVAAIFAPLPKRKSLMVDTLLIVHHPRRISHIEPRPNLKGVFAAIYRA